MNDKDNERRPPGVEGEDLLIANKRGLGLHEVEGLDLAGG